MYNITGIWKQFVVTVFHLMCGTLNPYKMESLIHKMFGLRPHGKQAYFQNNNGA